MALDPPTEEQKRKEFAAPPVETPPSFGTGRPEDDLLGTFRIQPPWTWERRNDPNTPRAVKVRRQGRCWVAIDPGFRMDETTWDEDLTDDDVWDWPIQHGVLVAATMTKLQPKQPAEPPRLLEGDMGVEAFMGEREIE